MAINSSGPAIKASARSKSVLFDIELDDVDGLGFTARDALAEWLAAQEGSQEQAKLTGDAHQAHMLALGPSGEVSLERFAQLLAMRGHHVWLRTGRLDCCCGQVALRHTFVLAGVAGSTGSDLLPQLFVVDPCFKEQFQLPNATPEYTALWQDLPNLFVGTAEQLVPIVELMCTEMQRVFADTATSCPPWRTPSCMLTKWLPSAADDVPVAAPGGSSGSCSSTRPSSSATNSSLSSPAGKLSTQTSGRAEFALPPIRTPTGCADATDGPAGLSPRSARSPLYFDQHEATFSRHSMLTPSISPAADELQGAAPAAHAHPKQARSVHWAAGDSTDLGAAAGDETCFMGSGSWGLGTFGSTVSSSGCGVFWTPLRSCHSEDGGQERSHTRSVAIAARANPRCDQGAAGNGFAAALVERTNLGRLREFSPDTAVPARHVSATATVPPAAAAAATRGSGSGFFCGYRSYAAAGNPTLDISRFDRNSVEDVPPAGPLAWGLGAERFGGSSMGLVRKLNSASAGSSKPPAGVGAMCPPVRRRSSTGSSQCSALSAAIAGKGVPMH